MLIKLGMLAFLSFECGSMKVSWDSRERSLTQLHSYGVEDAEYAISQLAQTTMRSEIGM